ncbi:MAG TPA: hypothetical protein VFD32_00100, partial [Dehalococcoidia bacterium]|nr:hypothetical protein [Dehalococcoidia bacterium]
RPYWSSEPVRGPAGTFHVVVTREPAGAGGRRDQYAATLYRKAEAGDEAVESGFWQHSAPPHDADKLAFRERARRAAEQAAAR